MVLPWEAESQQVDTTEPLPYKWLHATKYKVHTHTHVKHACRWNVMKNSQIITLNSRNLDAAFIICSLAECSLYFQIRKPLPMIADGNAFWQVWMGIPFELSRAVSCIRDRRKIRALSWTYIIPICARNIQRIHDSALKLVPLIWYIGGMRFFGNCSHYLIREIVESSYNFHIVHERKT